MKYCLLSISRSAIERHPEAYNMLGLPGTPYVWGDSDHSAQLIGCVITDDVERVYWASPERQGYQVVEDLHNHTREKVRVQWTIPDRFTKHMREHVESLRVSREYRSERERGVLIGV